MEKSLPQSLEDSLMRNGEKEEQEDKCRYLIHLDPSQSSILPASLTQLHNHGTPPGAVGPHRALHSELSDTEAVGPPGRLEKGGNYCMETDLLAHTWYYW
jgi:hypothetical protein